MKNQKLTAICMAVLFSIFNFQALYPAQVSPDGKAIYIKKCTFCHGTDGARGRFGAADLKISRLPDDSIIFRIMSGGKKMPAFRKKLNEEEIGSLKAYVKTLRN